MEALKVKTSYCKKCGGFILVSALPVDKKQEKEHMKFLNEGFGLGIETLPIFKRRGFIKYEDCIAGKCEKNSNKKKENAIAKTSKLNDLSWDDDEF